MKIRPLDHFRTLLGCGLAVAALAACGSDDDAPGPAAPAGGGGQGGQSQAGGRGGQGGASGGGGAAGSKVIAPDPEADEVRARVSAPVPAGQPCALRNVLRNPQTEVSRVSRLGYDSAGRLWFIDRGEDATGEGGGGAGGASGGGGAGGGAGGAGGGAGGAGGAGGGGAAGGASAGAGGGAGAGAGGGGAGGGAAGGAPWASGAVVQRTGLFYDDDGRARRALLVESAGGPRVSERVFAYDAAGRLASITALGDEAPPALTLAYEAGGARWTLAQAGAALGVVVTDAAAKTLDAPSTVDFFAPLIKGRTTFRDALPAPADLFPPALAGFLAAHPLRGVEDVDGDGTPEREATYEYEGESLARVAVSDVADPQTLVAFELAYACGSPGP